MQSVLERDFLKPYVVTDQVRPNGKPKPVRWTVSEYYQMADLGFFRGKRVELIRGEIVQMSPMGKPHANSIRALVFLLQRIFKKGFVVQSQLPMTLGEANEPEPDVAVLEGSRADFADTHPTTAALVVEVAGSTLRFDREDKAELYAENNIPEYWVVNLKERRLEVHRYPTKDKTSGFFYSEVTIVGENQTVSPLAKPSAKIKGADMLP